MLFPTTLTFNCCPTSPHIKLNIILDWFVYLLFIIIFKFRHEKVIHFCFELSVVIVPTQPEKSGNLKNVFPRFEKVVCFACYCKYRGEIHNLMPNLIIL